MTQDVAYIPCVPPQMHTTCTLDGGAGAKVQGLGVEDAIARVALRAWDCARAGTPRGRAPWPCYEVVLALLGTLAGTVGKQMVRRVAQCQEDGPDC